MRSLRPILGLAACLCIGAVPARAESPAETVALAFRHALPNLPGQTVTGLLVTYPPAGRSHPHHHAGSVVAYVLSGAVRSENSATWRTRWRSTPE